MKFHESDNERTKGATYDQERDHRKQVYVVNKSVMTITFTGNNHRLFSRLAISDHRLTAFECELAMPGKKIITFLTNIHLKVTHLAKQTMSGHA